MAIIQVPHTVRVWAFVDTDTEEVVKVVEDTGGVELEDEGVMLDEEYEPVPWDRNAERIAEEQDWPAWDR